MKRHTLLLDLDGTLVDSVPDLTASLNRLMARRALPAFGASEVQAMVGDGATALVAKAMVIRQCTPDPADVADFIADYTAHAAVQTRPYPGVPATLDALLLQGWRIGICTNKPEAATRHLLFALGLMNRFAEIAGGDTFSRRKPHPDHLLGLLHAMGSDAGDAVMVGDHHNDVLAAQGAGVPCIFAAWGYGNLKMAEGASVVAQSFAELPMILAKMS